MLTCKVSQGLSSYSMKYHNNVEIGGHLNHKQCQRDRQRGAAIGKVVHHTREKENTGRGKKNTKGRNTLPSEHQIKLVTYALTYRS